MDPFALIAERKIQEAMEEGVFDDLPGAGKPIPEEDDPCLDPAQRMANRILKNAGITPDWIAEGREIERELNRLSTVPSAERDRAHVAVRRPAGGGRRRARASDRGDADGSLVARPQLR